MNRFLKTDLRWLGVPGLALLIVLLAYIFRPVSPGYKIEAHEIPALMMNQSKHIDMKDLAGKQLIDVRPASVFAKGHPENAINIPVRQLLDQQSLEIFDQLKKNGQQAVLYGTDELQATAPWLLLQQLGYSNLHLLKGGAGSDGELKETPVALTEISVVDTSAFRAAREQPDPAILNPPAKKAASVIPARREASAGGGC